MLVMVVTLSVAGGAIPAFSSYLPAFFAFFLPTTIPSIFWSVASKGSVSRSSGYACSHAGFRSCDGRPGGSCQSELQRARGLRIRTNELAKDLRKQKELAEQASLAKSSFWPLPAMTYDSRFMRWDYSSVRFVQSRCLPKEFVWSKELKSWL